MTHILVINSGSSSLKYQLIDPVSGERRASELIERIGTTTSRHEHREAGQAPAVTEAPVPHHAAGFAALRAAFAGGGSPLAERGIAAVGHRVVQGGCDFIGPTLITDEVAARILELGALAPLHNPAQHQAIVAAREVFADVPHIAVFDTAFHHTISPAAREYAIDREVAARHGLRRYGFHGTSHSVVSRRAAEFLGRPLGELRQIVLHLGSGASACAIDGGRSIDTSMGLTPLEGIVMGTRSGDIDPGLLLYLLREGMSAAELDTLLNQRSGLLGLSGANDLRDVLAARAAGDPAAELAFDVYVRSVRRYIGAYLVALGGADTLVFTAGVGEHSAVARAAICAGLEWCGVRLDPEHNAADAHGPRRISSDDSRIAVLVVPTDEEAEIARQSWQLVSELSTSLAPVAPNV